MPCAANSLNGCGLMPLELLSFQVSQIENGASISWKAVHDESIRLISLQHSINARDWTFMSEWQPTGPDFDRGDYMHQNIASGTHYYRLHTQYSDGANELSDVAILQQCYDIDNVSVWPNPSTGMIDIFVQSIEQLHTTEFLLVDAHGKICISKSGSHQVQLDISALPGGVYFLHVPALGIVQRVVKT
jgi:hypothetical protein